MRFVKTIGVYVFASAGQFFSDRQEKQKERLRFCYWLLAAMDTLRTCSKFYHILWNFKKCTFSS